MNLKGCNSHNTDHWATPKAIYDRFIKNGFIDPCPLHSKEDNLNKIYKDAKIYINPPYSQIKEWTKFIENNYQSNKCIILLIPARTDTEYFHKLLELDPHIYFIKGRLKFNETGCAPFPSILMEFTPYKSYKFRYTSLDKEILS